MIGSKLGILMDYTHPTMSTILESNGDIEVYGELNKSRVKIKFPAECSDKVIIDVLTSLGFKFKEGK